MISVERKQKRRGKKKLANIENVFRRSAVCRLLDAPKLMLLPSFSTVDGADEHCWNWQYVNRWEMIRQIVLMARIAHPFVTSNVNIQTHMHTTMMPTIAIEAFFLLVDFVTHRSEIRGLQLTLIDNSATVDSFFFVASTSVNKSIEMNDENREKTEKNAQKRSKKKKMKQNFRSHQNEYENVYVLSIVYREMKASNVKSKNIKWEKLNEDKFTENIIKSRKCCHTLNE